MLATVSDKVRSFVFPKAGGDSVNPRKRPLERDDDDVRIVETPKRQRTDCSPPKQHSPWQARFGAVAEWIVRAKSSFQESYYFRELTSHVSPQRISSAVAGIFSSHPSQAAPQPPLSTQGPTLNSNNSKTGNDVPPLKLPNMHLNNSRPTNRQTEMGQRHSRQPEASDNPDKRFKMPIQSCLSRGTPSNDISQPCRRKDPDLRATQSKNAAGGKSERSFRSVYDKKYGTSASQESLANSSRRSSNSSISSNTSCRGYTARQSIRMGEKARYQQLLQQFTTAPLPGTMFGSNYIRKPRYVPSDETILGSERPKKSAFFQEKLDSSTHSLPRTRVQPTHELSSQKRQAESRPRQDLLTDTSQVNTSRFASPALRPATNLSTPIQHTNLKTESPQVVKIEKVQPKTIERTFKSPLHDALASSPYVSEDWIEEMRSHFESSTKQRQRQIEETKVTLSYHKEKREEYDASLEEKIRERMRLSESIPPVLADEYESSEEEEEEEELPPLTGEMEDMIDVALSSPPSRILADAFKLQISNNDIRTLSGLNWLNDEIINFYMNMLMDRGTQEGFAKVHSFNTFFYPKLMSGGHQALRRWTKRVDIFAVDYILIPVHLGMHWCLAVVDFPEKELRYYDSMGGKNPRCLHALRDYLEKESLDKKQTTYDTSDWTLEIVEDIPQQMNGSDCGMFACKYAEYITRGKEITFTQEDMPYFRRRMIYEIITKKLLQ